METVPATNGLDKKDLEILYELDLDSRQSFQSLGRKVGLGKETVFHRVRKLQERGIIDKFITIFNVHKIGYQNYRLLLKFKNIDDVSEERIIDFLKKLKSTGWIVSIEGNWNLGVWFMVKDLYSFKKEYNQFKEQFSNYIADEKLSIFSDVYYFSRSYLISQKNTEKLEVKIPESIQKITEEEWKIMNTLAENSRTSVLEIAKHANISPKTAIKKIRELENKKIILGYRLKINLEKIGIEYFKLHLKLNQLVGDDLKDIRSFIFSHPNIIYLDETISGYDLELDIQVKNKSDLQEIISTLKDKFKKNIENYDILSYTKEHKHVFLSL